MRARGTYQAAMKVNQGQGGAARFAQPPQMAFCSMGILPMIVGIQRQEGEGEGMKRFRILAD